MVFRFVPILIGFFFFLLCPAFAEDVATLNVVYTTKPNPPRILGEGTAIEWKRPGITIELLKMVEHKTGIPFKFRRVPWKRGLHMLQTGSADATFHASYKEKRALYADYPMYEGQLDATRRVYDNNYALYVKQGSFVQFDGKRIINALRPIGAQLDFAIADDLRKLGYTVQEEASVDSNFNKLLAGRISAYAEIESLADSEIKSKPNRYGDVVKLQPLLKEKN